MNNILEWILTIIGSGGVGAAITYISTFKYKKEQVKIETELSETHLRQAQLDLSQDKCDYLQQTCDKYIKDYHELEQNFRKQVRELQETINDLTFQNSKMIADKCNEIASLKSQITYLKGLRCYDSTCSKRIKTNPDKTEE